MVLWFLIPCLVDLTLGAGPNKLSTFVLAANKSEVSPESELASSSGQYGTSCLGLWKLATSPA